MKLFFLSLLCFCITAGSALAVTQNVPWTVFSPTQQSSPYVVNVGVTPSAFVGSTFNGTLKATCLGLCPGTPSYVLQSAQSGFCSGNNNNSFTLSGANNSTISASGLSSTTTYYACIAVNMPGANNSGHLFQVVVPGVTSPAVQNIVITPAYFNAGTTFAGTLDISCKPNGFTPYVGGSQGCPGLPTYALNNTPGACTHANDAAFSISGSTLSITTPQTTVKDYFACVNVTVPGTTNSGAPFEVVATISRGPSGSPNINNVLLKPLTYTTNSTFSGDLVTECLSTATLQDVPCGNSPSYALLNTRPCGGGDNNNLFTLSGTNNAIMTGNMSGLSGNLFPCVTVTVPGAANSPTSVYVRMTSGDAPTTINSISAVPTSFPTSIGSVTSYLRPRCYTGLSAAGTGPMGVCTSRPVYTLDNIAGHCASNDNNVFSLSGDALTITTSTPRTYNACVAVAMGGASNSGNSFQVPITATTSASNCPATPPLQAQDAGFTQLVWCVDPADPRYDNIFNWIACATNVVPQTTTQDFQIPVSQGDCGVSGPHPMVTRVIDHTTGKYVLDFHWDGLADANAQSANDGNPGIWGLWDFTHNYPTGMYAEIRLRMSPTAMPLNPGTGLPYMYGFAGCCWPDFWTFADGSGGEGPNGVPTGCVKYSLTNWCYNGGTESDIIESTLGTGLLDGIAETGMPSDPNNGNAHPADRWKGTGFFISDPTHSFEEWEYNMLRGMPFENYTNFGMRYATDGVGTRQNCFYWDNIVVKTPAFNTGVSPDLTGCQWADFTGLPSISYGKLRLRNQFDLQIAGGWAYNSMICKAASACAAAGDQGRQDQDTYIEYIAVWSCPAWNNYNQQNGFDSQVPCPVSLPYPY